MAMKLCEEGNHMVERLFWSKKPNRKSACLSCSRKYGTPTGNNKMASNKASLSVKNPKPIPKVSKKQLSRLKGYSELRKEYMNSHKLCEAKIEGCTGRAESIHHLKGRDGDNLFKHFMATCNHCHEKIERMGSEVYELGFKLKRTEE